MLTDAQHVLKLDLDKQRWDLVDNFGDIPGVRMGAYTRDRAWWSTKKVAGHTATLWQGDKLLVFGGENEHRTHLSDLIIFDLATATWTQPQVHGAQPRPRARHAAFIYDGKLWITGGQAGAQNDVLDDICYIDLATWTWSRPWAFVPRFDHTAWVWGGRIWVFGGMGEDMSLTSELWWIDFRGNPALGLGSDAARGSSGSTSKFRSGSASLQGAGHGANGSAAVQRNPPHHFRTQSPGFVSMHRFIANPHLPEQSRGKHFHAYTSGCLLDFVTPGEDFTSPLETSLCVLDLATLRWHRLAEGKDLFNPKYRWHYCTLNADGTEAWLLGCPPAASNPAANNAAPTADDELSDVLRIDLASLGIVGNRAHAERAQGPAFPLGAPASDAVHASPFSAIGADLAAMFDRPPESGSGADFVVVGESDDPSNAAVGTQLAITDNGMDDAAGSDAGSSAAGGAAAPSKPIHVHRLILQARWPHFARLYAAQMREFHTRKLVLPEPYAAVRAFLQYLYTDSVAEARPADVAGMLVLANLYAMPRLRALCVERLGRELDVESAACVWERAGVAGEAGLRRRAAGFCLTWWGKVVRTEGFRSLGRAALVELCEEVDEDGRVVGGAELEFVGGLWGARLGAGEGRRGGRASVEAEEDEGEEGEEGEGEMDVG
jgi:hypothetical protein